ncbi:DUF805 domain-containing protein [Gryllotalpicola koreensis]|uniref:DUF805 domain-containing protein n=1 Tax=Gryllotalpicola koreensis TaxID=993086 RepID=A0ABP8ACQ3_9MICO
MTDVPPPPPPAPPTPPVPPPPPGYGGSGYATAGEPPIDQPYYGAPLSAAVRRFFTKYVVFSGRASRAEFWWWALISWLINVVLGFFQNHHNADGSLTGLSITFSTISGLWGLAILIPWLALWFRRLHDANHSGWNLFWWFLPIIGWIILLVFVIQGPKPEGARFDR